MGILFYLHSSFAHQDLGLYGLAWTLVVFHGLVKSVHSLPSRRTSFELKVGIRFAKFLVNLKTILVFEETVTKLVHCFSPPTCL
jgi:hypothetical protein